MSNEFYLSSIKSLLEAYKANGDLNEQDWVILKRCNSEQNCETYIERFKGTEHERLVPFIYKISLRYRGSTYQCFDEFDAECLYSVFEYEDAKREILKNNRPASRVKQSGKRNGWKNTIEGLVSAKGTSDGFKLLIKGNRLDASFEVFVLDNKDKFPLNVVDAAKARLLENGYPLGL
jgi:hypothetical protein